MDNLDKIIDLLNKNSKPFAELPEEQKPAMAREITEKFKKALIEEVEEGA